MASTYVGQEKVFSKWEIGMLRENIPDAAKVEGRGVLNGWASMAEKGGKGQAGLRIGGKDRKGGACATQLVGRTAGPPGFCSLRTQNSLCEIGSEVT